MADAIGKGRDQAASAAKKMTGSQVIAVEVRGAKEKQRIIQGRVVVRGEVAARSGGVREYYAEVYSASPEDRIGMIRQGVPAREAKRIIKDLGVEQKVFYDALGLKTATVNRKVKRNDPLSSDESERLLGVAKLVGQLETIVSESGDAEGFDATGWMSRWLREPLPALGGATPISFLDTMEGQALVSDALARIQSGAYA